MNDRSGDGTGSQTKTAKFTNMIVARFRDSRHLFRESDVFIEDTRCSAVAERPHCKVRYSFRQKYKSGTGRQYFTNIIGLSRATMM